ncbi:uncharacterized protein DS421_12g372400 [Arachis hypogaea]|nr:uncharacterized protein DS421_12g372400 [Arachis hypogaea]
MKSGIGFRSDGSDLRPYAADGVDLVEVSTESAGVGEAPVIAGDLAAVRDPDRAVVGDGKGGRETLGGGTDGLDDGSIDAGEGRGSGGRAEVGVYAVKGGLVSKLLCGEATGGGGDLIGAQEGEEDGEDFGVPVYENRVGVVGGAVREDKEEGVWTGGPDGREGCLEELAADVELDAFAGGLGL